MSFSRNDTKMIKGMAIILMFYHHLFAFPERLQENITYVSSFYLGENSISFHIGEFGKLCVALFMFLAGYGTYLSSKKEENLSFLGKKIINLYRVYWQVFLLVVPISIIIGKGWKGFVLKEFIWNLIGLDITYNGEWWFFTTYIILIFAFPGIKKFIDRKNSYFIYDVLCIVLVNAIIMLLVPEIVSMPLCEKLSSSLIWIKLYQAMTWLPVFMFGCVFAKYDVLSTVKKKFSGNYLSILISILILAGVFYMRHIYYSKYDFINAPIFICGLVVALSGRIGRCIQPILIKIGEESTIIWLTHSFYCYKWCQKLVYAPKYAPLIVLWLLSITYVTSRVVKALWGNFELLYFKNKEKLKVFK